MVFALYLSFRTMLFMKIEIYVEGISRLDGTAIFRLDGTAIFHLDGTAI